MDTENPFGPDTEKANFPIHWAGQSKPLKVGGYAFVCGACPDPDACLEDRCTRAEHEDFEESVKRMGGFNL